jgi:hypothetical protein
MLACIVAWNVFAVFITFRMRRDFFINELTCYHEMQLVLTKFGSVRNQLVPAEQVENM